MFETIFQLHAAAVLGPGLPNLQTLLHAANEDLTIDTECPLEVPAPDQLPQNERRRSSQAVRLVLACLKALEEESPWPLGNLRSVFSTNDGTGEVSQSMLDALAKTRDVSPLAFPNSVHNAASGYFSISHQNQEPSTVISMGLDSFSAGLLCALTDAIYLNQPVLLVCFDPAMTGPLLEQLPVQQSTACAWIVSTQPPVAPNLVRYRATLRPERSADPLPNWIPSCWGHNSSAWGLAALSLISDKQNLPFRLGFGTNTLTLQTI